MGAGVGAVGGGVAGAKAKKAYKLANQTNGRMKRLVVAEFAVCIVIVALSPLTDRHKEEAPAAWMKRMTAVLALFFILGIISAMGRGAAKAAAGLGGLVTVALLVSERDLLARLADLFDSKGTAEAAAEAAAAGAAKLRGTGTAPGGAGD